MLVVCYKSYHLVSVEVDLWSSLRTDPAQKADLFIAGPFQLSSFSRIFSHMSFALSCLVVHHAISFLQSNPLRSQVQPVKVPETYNGLLLL